MLPEFTFRYLCWGAASWAASVYFDRLIVVNRQLHKARNFHYRFGKMKHRTEYTIKLHEARESGRNVEASGASRETYLGRRYRRLETLIVDRLAPDHFISSPPHLLICDLNQNLKGTGSSWPHLSPLFSRKTHYHCSTHLRASSTKRPATTTILYSGFNQRRMELSRNTNFGSRL